MQQTLLILGVACIIAAVVGGGLKVFSIEIPVLKSGLRQAGLGVVGIALLGIGLVIGPGDNLSGGETSPSGSSTSPPTSTSNRPDSGETSTTQSPSDDESGESDQGSTTEQPSPDFPEGSRRAFTVDFTDLSLSESEHGSVSLGFGNSLVLEPASNTWIGPGSSIDVENVEGDFVCDVRFRVEERGPDASLNLSLDGSGNNAPRVDLVFGIWGEERATYSLKKMRVKTEDLAVPHVVNEATIANREELSPEVADHDWSTGSELTLKREGGDMQFFVNDRFVKRFDVSVFPVTSIGIGAAFDSRIVITSIEFRTRPG